MRAGRIPQSFLPLQSGVGDIANAVLGALGAHPEIPNFQMYTEVLQDSVIPLLENGRCRFASTCSLTLSPEMMARVTGDLNTSVSASSCARRRSRTIPKSSAVWASFR